MTQIQEAKATLNPVTRQTDRERAQSRWITVEPIIILTMMGYTCIALVKPLFVKDMLSQSYNYTEPSNTNKCTVAHSGNGSLEDQIQSESSMWLLYLGAASGVPAMLSSTVFCTVSDRLGRKLAMALPAIGFAIQAAVYGVTVHFKLPLATLLAGEFVQGLAGGFGLLFAACISYLADATTERQRTMRIVIAEMLTFLVGGLNQVAQGYLIKISYLPSLAIAFGCNSAAFLYIILPPFLIETVDNRGFDRKEFFEAWRSMKRLLEFNENGRRWQMLFLDFFIFFCVCQFQGMLVGTKVFSFCLGDYWLMQISCLSTVISYLTIGLARSTLVIFLGTAVGFLRGMSIPVARSVLSKITHPDDIGAMFSIVGCLESLTFASGLLANSIYAASVSFVPPLTFFVYSGATLIPAGITLLLQLCWPRRKEYTSLNVIVNAD
ncbi:proton-coupled folate transporter-like [Acanthaster planci]|uniref:Proton-coupled folate transporter n=1 Tax=Acanthaster planci TaxID=133434 RepID=A0A8B7ZXR4_ACAPL|nr:proton-coupled folate transporter-like [Acanthaster planci]